MSEKPKLAKTHVRAGEQLAAYMGVETKIIDGRNKAFCYDGQPLACSSSPTEIAVCGRILPRRVARALGHFLVNEAREIR